MICRASELSITTLVIWHSECHTSKAMGAVLHESALRSERSKEWLGATITKLTPGEVVARMERGERFVFIDARSSKEWEAADSKLPGAIHVPVDKIIQYLKEIPLGHPVVSYCSSPSEQLSAQVAQELMRRGFLNTHPLIGGVEAWRKAGYPLEPK